MSRMGLSNGKCTETVMLLTELGIDQVIGQPNIQCQSLLVTQFSTGSQIIINRNEFDNCRPKIYMYSKIYLLNFVYSSSIFSFTAESCREFSNKDGGNLDRNSKLLPTVFLGLELSFFLTFPGDSKSWESPDEVDMFDGYLFKYCSVKYQTFHQVSEKTSQQTYPHQKPTEKLSRCFQEP